MLLNYLLSTDEQLQKQAAGPGLGAQASGLADQGLGLANQGISQFRGLPSAAQGGIGGAALGAGGGLLSYLLSNKEDKSLLARVLGGAALGGGVGAAGGYGYDHRQELGHALAGESGQKEPFAPIAQHANDPSYAEAVRVGKMLAGGDAYNAAHANDGAFVKAIAPTAKTIVEAPGNALEGITHTKQVSQQAKDIADLQAKIKKILAQQQGAAVPPVR